MSDEKGSATAVPEDIGAVTVDLSDAPYWGKVTPSQEFSYKDRDGTPLFYIGQFTFPGSFRQEFRPIYYNGREWIVKLPPSFSENTPLYNLCEVYDWKGSGKEDRPVIIVNNVLEAQLLQDYMDEIGGEYAVVSVYGTFKDIRKTNFEDLRNRDVYLLPAMSEYSRQWMQIVKACVSPYVNTLRWVDPPENATSMWTIVDPVKKKDWTEISLALKTAYEVPKDVPQVELDRYGFSHLEGEVPEMFINQLIENYGKPGKDGRKIIPNTFMGLMNIIKEDPSFEHFVKFDEGVGTAVWSSRYHTIDEVKNALMRRLSQYRVGNISVQMREDIISSITSDKRHRINTVKAFFEELVAKYPNADEYALENLMSFIEIEDRKDDSIGPSRKYYTKAFELFFTKACLLIQTSAQQNGSFANDVCPVLVGTQGIGKSRFVRYLAMDNKFFTDLGNKGHAALGSPDCTRLITGKFIAELGEMSVYRKSDVETVKSWISETKDSLTPKFKEGARDFPRTVSAVGTSNNDAFLKDTTGNRRFFPMHIKKIDHIGLYNDISIIEKVWAYYYKLCLNALNDTQDVNRTVINAMITQSSDMVSYFELVRNDAVDLGVAGDFFKQKILEVEKKHYGMLITKGSGHRYIRMSVLNIATAVFGAGREHDAMPDFKKKVWFIAQSLGYRQIRIESTVFFEIDKFSSEFKKRNDPTDYVEDIVTTDTSKYGKPVIDASELSVEISASEAMDAHDSSISIPRSDSDVIIEQKPGRARRAWD